MLFLSSPDWFCSKVQLCCWAHGYLKLHIDPIGIFVGGGRMSGYWGRQQWRQTSICIGFGGYWSGVHSYCVEGGKLLMMWGDHRKWAACWQTLTMAWLTMSVCVALVIWSGAFYTLLRHILYLTTSAHNLCRQWCVTSYVLENGCVQKLTGYIVERCKTIRWLLLVVLAFTVALNHMDMQPFGEAPLLAVIAAV